MHLEIILKLLYLISTQTLYIILLDIEDMFGCVPNSCGCGFKACLTWTWDYRSIEAFPCLLGCRYAKRKEGQQDFSMSVYGT